jgi:hypothetical protein
MVDYNPPADLSRLNPIQRYMHKGELEWTDYYWLIAIVFVYIMARPTLQNLFARSFGGNAAESEGVGEREAYYERRAKVGPNAIRGERDDPIDITNDNAADVTTTGSVNKTNGAVSNRKGKGPKSEADKLLDWDGEPSRDTSEGDKTDVMQWLNKWDKEAS